LLTVTHLDRRVADLLLLDDVSFSVNAGDRIGIVGPNGVGKTTLLRLLAGIDQPTSGAIAREPGLAIGYLRQGFADLPDGTLADLLDIPTGGLLAANARLEVAAIALGDPDGSPEDLANAYDLALNDFEAAGGYALLAELEALLDRFGLGGLPMDRPLATFSGGQKTRAGLAGLLAARPDLLLLDEPTNHLDIDALDWLGDFLTSYRGAIVMVSHDRGFLDAVATEIFELDPTTRQLTIYPGNYSAYVAAKEHAEEEHAAAWMRQQKEVRKIQQDIRRMEQTSRNIEASTIDFAVRKKAAKIVRPAVVRKAKLERMLDSEEAIDKPTRTWGLSMDFATTAHGARDVVALDSVNVAFDEVSVLRDVSLDIRHGDRVALIGPNGSGKSTLVRVIAGDLAPTSGMRRLGAGVRVGYFAQEQEILDLGKTVLEQVRSEATMSESDTRTFLHRYLFAGDMVHRMIGSLSYGERARLMLALLALRGTNLLLLDEPLNHLDVTSREEFERALAQFDGTIVIVLHDRYAASRIATRVVEVRGGTVREVDVAALMV